MSAFPDFLPRPSTSFTANVEPAVIRSRMDSGRIRQRRRFTRELVEYSTQWEFTPWQFGMFQSWVKHKISNGADAFTIDLPIGRGDAAAVFTNVSAKLVEGNYLASYNLSHWTVSATLEVEAPGVWTEAEYDTNALNPNP